jgi:hypothetical protein
MPSPEQKVSISGGTQMRQAGPKSLSLIPDTEFPTCILHKQTARDWTGLSIARTIIESWGGANGAKKIDPVGALSFKGSGFECSAIEQRDHRISAKRIRSQPSEPRSQLRSLCDRYVAHQQIAGADLIEDQTARIDQIILGSRYHRAVVIADAFVPLPARAPAEASPPSRSAAPIRRHPAL